MSRMDRRSTLQLALAAALVPALAPTRAFAMDALRLIAPPTVPMRYTRTVSRALIDGALFTVSRDFTVEFRRFADGYMLHGDQSQVAVECPQSLSAFADMERARDESGLFPFALDPFGQIRSARIALPAYDHVRTAVEEALEALATQPIAADEREQASRFVSALQQAGHAITATMPTDLFAPTALSRRDERSVALPDGTQGSVETVFTCERDPETGLMRTARREIITRVGGSARETTERWSLATA